MLIKSRKHTDGQDTQGQHKLFISFLIIVFILPWPHGGELTWQYLLFCVGIFSLGATFFISKPTHSNYLVLEEKSTGWAFYAIVSWLLYQVIQVIPLPINFSNIADQETLHRSSQTISVAPYITLIEIIKHSSYIIFFVLALLLLNTKKRILTLTNTIFVSSAIIAIYSLINHYTKGAFDLIKSIPPWTVSWEKAAHGTFSYQNHYASFLTLTIPLGFGLFYSNIKNSTRDTGSKTKLQKTINLVMSINILYLLSLAIMFTALFKTASRGGNAIFYISIVITFFCMLLMQNKTKKEKVRKTALSTVSVFALGLIIINSGIADNLTKRVESEGYNPSGRTLMYQTALLIIAERPFVGTGAGTYPILQHKYKSSKSSASEMSKRVHNEYLELLTNQGIIGFSLLAVATILLFIKLFKGLNENISRSKKSKDLYGLQVACFCSVISILLHSLVDFNFHLPVNAVYYYLIVAIGISCQEIRKPQQRIKTSAFN